MTQAAKLSAHKKIAEPRLLFGQDKHDIHPLRGLIDYGPYSKKYGYITNVKVASITPARMKDKVSKLISELNNTHTPIEAKDYYPDYPGFEKLFEVPISDGR